MPFNTGRQPPHSLLKIPEMASLFRFVGWNHKMLKETVSSYQCNDHFGYCDLITVMRAENGYDIAINQQGGSQNETEG